MFIRAYSDRRLKKNYRFKGGFFNYRFSLQEKFVAC